MGKELEKENNNDIEKWEAQLTEMGAVDNIPDDSYGSAEVLNKLAYLYTRASISVSRHNDYFKLAESAYKAALSMEGHEDDRSALRGLAYIYYREFNYFGLWQRRNHGRMVCSKESCEHNAMVLYDRLIELGGNVNDYYRYAYLLYNSSSSFSETTEYADVLAKKERSFSLYHDAIAAYGTLEDENKETMYRTYIKACYGLARCGLELLCSRSRLLDELVVLFNFESQLYTDHVLETQRFQDIQTCLQIVLESENLPVVIEKGINSIAKKAQDVEKSWDIYYSLGNMYDYAFQYKLVDDLEGAYQSAIQYYTYSCDIDYIRRKENLPTSRFTHMYTALFNILLRGRQESAFCKAWKKYNDIIQFSVLERTVLQARWKIAKKDYSSAQSLLLDCKKEKGDSFLQRRVEMLLDLLHIVTKGISQEVENKYRPYQVRQFNKLLIHMNDM